MALSRKFYFLLVALILTLNPLGVIVSCLFRPEADPWKHYSLFGYLFATIFASVPVGTLLFFHWQRKTQQPKDYGLMVTLPIAYVLSLAGQALAFHERATDAQAALLFIFAPVYAGFVVSILYYVVNFVMKFFS